MTFKLPSIVLVVCLFSAVALETRACTSFGLCDGTNIAVGNNDDWFSVSAYLVANQRGITKSALFQSTNAPLLTWTSKYGSVGVDFNAIGIPSAGMNEAGLVVDELNPGKPTYEPADIRPIIDEILWIQYQLDNCATVDEVIATHEQIRIVPYYWHSHYFVYDRHGDAASIGFENGKLVATKIPRSGVQVLANVPYEKQLEKNNTLTPAQQVRKPNGRMSSAARFFVASEMARSFKQASNPPPAVNYAFKMLAEVSQSWVATNGAAPATQGYTNPPVTSISWVYDPVNLAIHYKTWTDGRTRTVHLKKFNFDGRKPMLLVDINIPKSGDISGDFMPYTLATSRLLVTQTIKDWRAAKFALHITDAEVERLIQYPETLKRVD